MKHRKKANTSVQGERHRQHKQTNPENKERPKEHFNETGQKTMEWLPASTAHSLHQLISSVNGFQNIPTKEN